MASATKTAPEKSAIVPAGAEWSECSYCYKIRRAPGGIVCGHRYWAADWAGAGATVCSPALAVIARPLPPKTMPRECGKPLEEDQGPIAEKEPNVPSKESINVYISI